MGLGLGLKEASALTYTGEIWYETLAVAWSALSDVCGFSYF